MRVNIAVVNAKYRDAARETLTEVLGPANIDPFTPNWGLDDREEVQHVEAGAFVHAWIWIPKERVANDAEPAQSEAPNVE